MSLLTLRSGDSFFEMGVAIEEGPSLPAQGDAYVTIKVQSKGFAGHNDLWVQSEAMHAFCSALITLERNLKGEAALEAEPLQHARVAEVTVGSSLNAVPAYLRYGFVPVGAVTEHAGLIYQPMKMTLDAQARVAGAMG